VVHLQITVNIKAEIIEATIILETARIAEPRREAKSLLAFVIKQDHTFLIAHHDYVLTAIEEKIFAEVIFRRSKREPLQHITENQEFYGLDFFVSKDVLIPRPETELIVEKSLRLLSENSTFCEVGIGSGCISVSILHKLVSATAIGLDISEKALKIAEMNAKTHNVSNRLTLKTSDIFSSLTTEKFDAIVSNPPYIASETISTLQPEVQYFEPLNALTDGGNGLSIVETLITESPKYLKPNGSLLIEIGFDQAEIVRSFAEKSKLWSQIDFLPDLQGHLRVVFLRM
jgi:release factor glutamine methyltransferase